MFIQVGGEQFCGRDSVPRVLRSTPTTAIIRPNEIRSTRNLANLILRSGALVEDPTAIKASFFSELKGS
jgi:hypothetical protein